MLRVYGNYKYFIFFSAGTDFNVYRCQILAYKGGPLPEMVKCNNSSCLTWINRVFCDISINGEITIPRPITSRHGLHMHEYSKVQETKQNLVLTGSYVTLFNNAS